MATSRPKRPTGALPKRKKPTPSTNTVPASSRPFGGKPITNTGRVITTPKTTVKKPSTTTTKKKTASTTVKSSKPLGAKVTNKPATTNLPYTGGASTTNLPYTGGATVTPLGSTPVYDPGYGQFGNPAGATGDISSVYATGRDTLSMEQLMAQFGIAAAVLANNPSLTQALNKILGKDGGPMITDPALQEAIIKGTSWYRDQTDTQRTYDYYKATNPGQFAADLQSNASSIVKQWASMGLNITADQAIEYANNMMKQVIIKDLIQSSLIRLAVLMVE
jgi:hypothetical protein